MMHFKREIGYEVKMLKHSPDEFQISSVLIGAFAFIWFDLFPQLKIEKQNFPHFL